MIRIRNSDKSVSELSDKAIFVELVDKNNNVVLVISQSPDQSSFNIFDGKSKEKAERYATYFNVKFVGDTKLITNPDKVFK